MAGDEGIFATTAEVQRKVGANVSATSNTEAFINQYIAEAESYINAETEFNWSDRYGSLDEDLRDILKLAASNLAAIYVINYDTDAFAVTDDAITRMNVLWNIAQAAIRLLKTKGAKEFINGEKP